MNIIKNKFLKLFMTSVILVLCGLARADINSDLINLCTRNAGCNAAVKNTDSAKYGAACAANAACKIHPTYLAWLASQPAVLASVGTQTDEIIDLDCNDPQVKAKYPTCYMTDQ